MKTIFLPLVLLIGLNATAQPQQPLESFYQQLARHARCVTLDYQPREAPTFSLDFADHTLNLSCHGKLAKVRVMLLQKDLPTQEVLAQTLLRLGFQRIPLSLTPPQESPVEILGTVTTEGTKQLCLLLRESKNRRQWLIALSGDVQIQSLQS